MRKELTTKRNHENNIRNENINKKIEITLKIEIRQNTVTELQNSLEGFNNRLTQNIQQT